MSLIEAGGIDCDIHPSVPNLKALFPYLTDHWRDIIVQRGVHELNSIAYPANSPLTARPDWRVEGIRPGSDLGLLRQHALEPFRTSIAIANCLYGVQLLFSEDMGAGFARAVNDWMAAEWLDKEPRLRASIVVPAQSPTLAIEEIERLSGDDRFVQILLPVGTEMMLGRRYYWPLFEAAQRHKLPIGLHAGTMYRHAPTSNGWPTHFLQDYVSNTQTFEAQLLSLVYEGVLGKFPELTFVLLESGVTWLPGLIWRAVKTWRGVRPEVPWVKESPAVQIRRQVRLTVQPIDSPPDAADLERVIDQIGSDDMLLFATDYPHWQFEGDAPLPDGIPSRLIEKITRENPFATYTRLQETVA
jgi:uncharacterized protein